MIKRAIDTVNGSGHDTTAYICECGKRWHLSGKEVSAKQTRTMKCVCGRTIVVKDGIVYGTRNPPPALRGTP